MRFGLGPRAQIISDLHANKHAMCSELGNMHQPPPTLQGSISIFGNRLSWVRVRCNVRVRTAREPVAPGNVMSFLEPKNVPAPFSGGVSDQLGQSFFMFGEKTPALFLKCIKKIWKTHALFHKYVTKRRKNARLLPFFVFEKPTPQKRLVSYGDLLYPCNVGSSGRGVFLRARYPCSVLGGCAS